MKLPITAWMLVLGLLSAPAAHSSTLSIQLPAETIPLRSAQMPGYTLATQKCGICHSADYVEFQPPGMDQTQWTGLVSKMRDNYKAPLSDSDIQSIGLYLSAAYGSEERAPLPVAQAGNLDDLLSRNACLGCHAPDQKIVGPSFKDIAQRYREQPEALRTVARHIGEGGSGRWGQIPMPPFTGLSSEEREQLARYVLEQ